MYTLRFYKDYWQKYETLTKRDELLKKRIKKALNLLATNPSHQSLRSHRVESMRFGIRWSSRITGDLRVIWDFDANDRLIILILTVGGHSGKGKVYR